MDSRVLRKMLELLEQKAEHLQMNDSIDGRLRSDAPQLRREIQLYRDGLEGSVPKQWEDTFKQAEKTLAREADPETYARYLELKKVFD